MVDDPWTEANRAKQQPATPRGSGSGDIAKKARWTNRSEEKAGHGRAVLDG
jgi:hypothetical protein